MWVFQGRLLEAYDATNDRDYLEDASKTFQFVMSGEDDRLGGGIYWREDRKRSKNTCSNAPAIVVALRLHQFTSRNEYLSIAKRLYDWTRSTLQEPDSRLYFDNIRMDGRIDRRKFSYNSALMIRVNCLFYETTGEDSYLHEAQRMTNAAEKRWIYPQTGAMSDTGKFAHMLLESLLILQQHDGNPHWLQLVGRCVRYVHDELRDPNGRYPSRWDTPPTKPLKSFKLIDQACVARALLVLAAINRSDRVNTEAWSNDPNQLKERTCFQTAKPWNEAWNLRSDVAIVYGIDGTLPDRIKTYRDRGYRIHTMTGVSWGQYQDYLYGRYDGKNHEDEAQTVSDGRKSSHGRDAYYMCPSESFGKFLCAGVQRALYSDVEAIHLEEPEFWVNSGYSEAFKREWRAYYEEPWQPPGQFVDAQWRASKLKYYLYRRTLQQVFDYVAAFNDRTQSDVRCYVPTHSLLNYAHWEIVSPESSLSRV